MTTGDDSRAGRTSLVLIIVALVAVAGLAAYWFVFAQDFECAECTTDADCGAELRCRPFEDGQSRCVDEELTCTEGHTRMPEWSRAVLYGALVVGGMALAWRQTKRKLG